MATSTNAYNVIKMFQDQFLNMNPEEAEETQE